MTNVFKGLKHLIRCGSSRTRNPYRMGDVMHPSMIRSPESGRPASDMMNLHSTAPKRAHKR